MTAPKKKPVVTSTTHRLDFCWTCADTIATSRAGMQRHIDTEHLAAASKSDPTDPKTTHDRRLPRLAIGATILAGPTLAPSSSPHDDRTRHPHVPRHPTPPRTRRDLPRLRRRPRRTCSSSSSHSSSSSSTLADDEWTECNQSPSPSHCPPCCASSNSVSSSPCSPDDRRAVLRHRRASPHGPTGEEATTTTRWGLRCMRCAVRADRQRPPTPALP